MTALKFESELDGKALEGDELRVYEQRLLQKTTIPERILLNFCLQLFKLFWYI
ncbi:hypothetical protein BTN49_0277 [Candidatus Enterovibrio escicola]|uniref:Uncharacterized protein n=1 Tax=Candidatus Enterovibrio escicola TaxID=1927127 RepID=A0A2A5T7F5_9GAMM|nr:hypothetical protein BTN49_0277 [Candidatus Enterovibrio escacola]